MALVTATDLHKRWGAVTALAGVSLAVEPGEVVTIVGPSGSGKSTLLRCLNGLEVPDSGSVEVAGRRVLAGTDDVNEVRAGIGMVFQSFHLFPHLDVIGNLTAAPMLVHGVPAAEAEARAHALLERVGLEDKAAARPEQLSGGQQQRVAIARALAMEPALMLFDEPTSALDPETVGEVLEVMHDLVGDGMTMIVVTHEMAFAREVSTRTLFMDEGRVVEQGPSAQIFDAPASERLRDFLSRVRSHDTGA